MWPSRISGGVSKRSSDQPGMLSTMLAFWGIARVTGFWETSLPAAAFRLAYRLMGIG